MTNLELQAIALAAEVETYIKTNNLTNLVLSLNEFRKAQLASDMQLGADLNAMHVQYVTSYCPVISLAELRKNKNRTK